MRCNYFLFGLSLLAAAAGCNKGMQAFPKTYPVHGKVFLDGRPLNSGMVELHPVGQTGAECSGVVKEGNFELRTFSNTGNDGAIPGEYKVLVRPLEVAEIGDKDKAKQQMKVPPRYASPDSSGITVTIKGGETDLPPIELTSGS